METPSFLTGGHGLPFMGVLSFNRAEHTRELDGAELVVMGVPFDAGTVNRAGARLGPRAIREQSVYAAAAQPIYPWRSGLDLRLVDYGDLAPVPGLGAVESLLESTEAAAAAVFAHGASLLTLGGDHTLPYGPVRAAAKAHGRLALVHLDAHQDSFDGRALGMLNHGTFATDLVNEGHLDPSRSAQLYIRTYLENPAGHTIVYAEEALRMGPEELAAQVRELVADGPVYLSLDLDAVDPAFAPGVGTPVPGGPSSGEIRRFLRGLEGLNIVAADLVELNPAYDPAQTTAVLAAFLAFDLLQLMASARKPPAPEHGGAGRQTQ